MSSTDIVSKIEQLKELEALIREAEKEVASLQSDLKAEMNRRDVEEMEAGRYIVRWKTIVSNRFDSTTFKAEMKELYDKYTKTSTSLRFSIVG